MATPDKPTPLPRRALLAGAAGTLAAAGAAALAHPQDAHAQEIVELLLFIALEQEGIARRLQRISARWQPPPDSDKPAIRDALTRIQTAAGTAQSLATEMLRRLG